MSSLLRKPLLRSKSHFSSEAAALLTHGPIGDVHTEETQHHQQSDDEESQTGPLEPRTLHRPKSEDGDGASWAGTAAVLLADMFGLGTLTLPADFAKLGWALGLLVTLSSAGGLMFSGLLFTRLSLLVPRAQTFADFGDAAYGRLGRRLVYAFVYSTIALEPVILQLICTENLRQILQRTRISQLAAGAAIAAVMVPLAQIQTLDQISWLAYAGTAGMLVGIAIVFAKLWLTLPAKPHPMVAVNTKDPRGGLEAVMDVVFTYGGQVNWVRYVAGMRRRGEFVRSTTFAGISMTLVYLTLGLYGYYTLGTDFDTSKPVTSIFSYDGWVVAMNTGILLHCIIAYQINLNVWTDMVLHLWTNAMESPEDRTSSQGRRIWFALTVLGIVYSLILSQLIPYFSLVMAIIAAIGDLTAAYALPALFCLKLSGALDRPMPQWQKIMCHGLIPLSVALSAVGLTSSVSSLVTRLMHRF